MGLTHLVEEEEGMQIYGAFKRVQELTRMDINEKDTPQNIEDMDEKSKKKYNAKQLCKSLTLDEAMKKYIDTLDGVAQRSDQKSKDQAENKNKKQCERMGTNIVNEKIGGINDNDDSPSVLYNATILGYGKALPSNCVTNDIIEKR